MTSLTDATFYAPLKTTLVPTNGSGNPTFTRATTKTVEDNEGDVKTLKSGAVALAGARAAQNLLRDVASPATSSENFSNCASTNVTLSYSAGVTTALSGAYPASFSFAAVQPSVIPTVTTGSRYYLKVKARGVGGSIGKKVNVTAAAIGDAGGNTSVTLTAIWQTITLYRTAKTNANSEYIGCDTFTGANANLDPGMSVEFTDLQISLTDDDYVSVGVLSAPFHGLGTDGAKCFGTDSSGVAIPDATMLGAQLDYASKTNSMLWCRDLTNAAWVKTNCTAEKTQTGVDGLANGGSLLTFNATDATILQTITAAATPACTGWKVKRSVGADPVYITRDGTNYTDISGLINSSTFTLVGIENTSVTNPVVGFKSSTGNELIVDSGRNHSGTQLCEDIFTTTAPVTRNAEVLTYQTSGNFSDTAGTILATIKRDNWANGNGSAVGKASFGLLTSASNSGVQAADGTNTVSGAAGTPTGQRKIGARWSGSSLQAFYEDEYGAIGSYDGSFNLSTIAVMPGTQGYIRDLAIFNTSLADTDMPWYVAPPPADDDTTYGRALGLAGDYFSFHNKLAQARYEHRTAKEKQQIESKKKAIKKIIKAEIKKDNFVLSGVERVIEKKGYNVDSDTYIMLYSILNDHEYDGIRGRINAALINMEAKTRQRLLQEEENEIMQIIALIH